MPAAAWALWIAGPWRVLKLSNRGLPPATDTAMVDVAGPGPPPGAPKPPHSAVEGSPGEPRGGNQIAAVASVGVQPNPPGGALDRCPQREGAFQELNLSCAPAQVANPGER